MLAYYFLLLLLYYTVLINQKGVKNMTSSHLQAPSTLMVHCDHKHREVREAQNNCASNATPQSPPSNSHQRLTIEGWG